MKGQRGSVSAEYVLVISVVTVASIGAAYSFVPDFRDGVAGLGSDVEMILSGGNIGSVGSSGGTVDGLADPDSASGPAAKPTPDSGQALANDLGTARGAGVGGDGDNAAARPDVILGSVTESRSGDSQQAAGLDLTNTCGQYAIALVRATSVKVVTQSTLGYYTRTVEVENRAGDLCAADSCSVITPLMSLSDVHAYLGKPRSTLSTASGFDDLQRSIENGRPAIVVIGEVKSGHIVTVVGTSSTRDDRTVTYQDANGRHTVPYSTFDETWQQHGRKMVSVEPIRKT